MTHSPMLRVLNIIPVIVFASRVPGGT
uniref:Uncharacterized protein n=1 Tax=Arundo donax TaxID=35708 RepID=A0A0A9CD80_ARUDO